MAVAVLSFLWLVSELVGNVMVSIKAMMLNSLLIRMMLKKIPMDPLSLHYFWWNPVFSDQWFNPFVVYFSNFIGHHVSVLRFCNSFSCLRFFAFLPYYLQNPQMLGISSCLTSLVQAPCEFCVSYFRRFLICALVSLVSVVHFSKGENP